jgi:cation diffusion facilitator family transporter
LKSRFFIYVALGADVGIAIIKFVAAAFTGSSAMASEGIHSIIDSINQVLLLIGIKSSQRKPDEQRPFGYGKELYFWSFIVSLLIFTLGGCVSFYEGIIRLKEPAPLKDQIWNYIVLAVAFLFTGISGIITLRKFNKERGDLNFWAAIRESKDPSVFTVLLNDLGDLVGLFIAFTGVFFGQLFHNYYYDGIASLLIEVILVAISIVLVLESKSLLMGETISKRTIRKIIVVAESDPSVQKVKKHFSMYMAPEEVVLQLIAVFKKNLTTQEITESIQRITATIQKEFPRIKQIFIEPA